MALASAAILVVSGRRNLLATIISPPESLMQNAAELGPGLPLDAPSVLHFNY